MHVSECCVEVHGGNGLMRGGGGAELCIARGGRGVLGGDAEHNETKHRYKDINTGCMSLGAWH